MLKENEHIDNLTKRMYAKYLKQPSTTASLTCTIDWVNTLMPKLAEEAEAEWLELI